MLSNAILLLTCLFVFTTPFAFAAVDFCTGPDTPDNAGGLGVSPTCTAIPAIDPLATSDAGTFQDGTVDTSGNLTFGVSVCELNPQGYVCNNFNNSGCWCEDWTNGISGTGRGPFDVVLDLVTSSGSTVDPAGCAFTTNIATSCSGGCGISTLTIPGSASLTSGCGFSQSTGADTITLFGYLRVTVTEHFLDIDGVTIDSRSNIKIGAYEISYPTTLTVTDSGITVDDPNVKAQIISSELSVLTGGTGTPTATVTLEVTVQNPLVLSLSASISNTGSGSGYSAVVSGTPNTAGCQNTAGACTDVYNLTLTGPTGCTLSEETYTMTITYGCQPGSVASGACPIQGSKTAQVIFSFEATNFCPTPQQVTITTSPANLLTFDDSSLAAAQHAFFTGATVFAEATNFVAVDLASVNVPISTVTLPSTATFSVSTTSASSAVSPVGSCTVSACAFSTAIPTSSLPQPATDSSETVTLSVVFSLVFTNGARRSVRTVFNPAGATVSSNIVIFSTQSTQNSAAASIAIPAVWSWLYSLW